MEPSSRARAPIPKVDLGDPIALLPPQMRGPARNRWRFILIGGWVVFAIAWLRYHGL